MKENYPTFKSKELNQLVERLKGLEIDVDGKNKELKVLTRERDATGLELRNRTYDWWVRYELKVRFEGRDKGFECWVNGFDVVGCIYPFGQYVETEEEAREGVDNTKKTLASLLEQKVKVRSILFPKQMEGIVTEYNIEWAQIEKGKDNIVHIEKRPTKRPWSDND